MDCQSCGAELHGSPDDHLCRGCNLYVCQTCVTVFTHWGDNEHGSGDPQARVLELNQAAARYRHIRERHWCDGGYVMAPIQCSHPRADPKKGELLDAAVDAAIEKLNAASA